MKPMLPNLEAVRMKMLNYTSKKTLQCKMKAIAECLSLFRKCCGAGDDCTRMMEYRMTLYTRYMRTGMLDCSGELELKVLNEIQKKYRPLFYPGLPKSRALREMFHEAISRVAVAEYKKEKHLRQPA